MPCRLPSTRCCTALAAFVLAACTVAVLVTLPRPARAQDEGRLRDRIATGKSRERALGSAAARLGRLEAAVTKEVAILQGRLSEAQGDLDVAIARLAETQNRLDAARRRVKRLRARLGQTRDQLATLLRARYMAQRPDLVSVVLDAHGFKDLVERFELLRRIEDADTAIVDLVRDARADAGRERRVLAALEQRQQDAAVTVRRRRDALASMQSAMEQRRAALAQARAARLLALHSARADRRRAQHELDRLLAERERAARAVGPGGPWAIPWPIVQCESGGQNLPPNSAGASGYYQMLPATWRGLGGSTPAAYQAPKAEQDRLAAKLWDGGRGAHNWVCAGLVGIV